MKKYLMIAAGAFALAFTAIAGVDFNSAKVVPVMQPQQITANATNEITMTRFGWKGGCELVVYANDVQERTALDVTLWGTNRIDGGWAPYASEIFTATNKCVGRVCFPGEFLPSEIKVSVGSIGAASTVSAVVLTH